MRQQVNEDAGNNSKVAPTFPYTTIWHKATTAYTTGYCTRLFEHLRCNRPRPNVAERSLITSCPAVSLSAFNTSPRQTHQWAQPSPCLLEMDSQLADLYASCHGSFQALLSAVRSPKRDTGDQMPPRDVESELDKLILWANNVGAIYSRDSYEVSLDYRLRKSPFYQERVWLPLVTFWQGSGLWLTVNRYRAFSIA